VTLDRLDSSLSIERMAMRMKRSLTLVLCGWSLTATLAAAQPAPAKPPQPQDPTPVPAPAPPTVAKPDPRPQQPAPAGRLTRGELTLRGCLQRDEAPTRGGEAERLTGGFVLRQALIVREDESSSAAKTEKAAAREYRVTTRNDSVKLGDHVNHQVEIVGRVSMENPAEPPASTEAGTSASRPSGSTGVATQPAGSQTPLPTLNATSLKMLAATCSTAS